MKDFLRNFASGYWWISVVLVGIIINILSAYLKSRLDRQLSSASVWWDARSSAKRRKRQAEVEKLRSDPHEQIMCGIFQLSTMLASVIFIVLGTLLVAGLTLLAASSSGRPELLVLLLFRLLLVPLLAALLLVVAFRLYLSAVAEMRILFESLKPEAPVSDLTQSDAETG